MLISKSVEIEINHHHRNWCSNHIEIYMKKPSQTVGHILQQYSTELFYQLGYVAYTDIYSCTRMTSF